MTEDIIAAIKERLGDAHKILITSHVRPDGDAVGSLLGFGLALQNAVITSYSIHYTKLYDGDEEAKAIVDTVEQTDTAAE